MNEGLMPEKDQKAIDLEIVKEQILDLNDKFDYLLYVMMKEKKIENKGGEFHIGSIQDAPAHSINREPSELEEYEVKDDVKNFEKFAKKKFGAERQRFRKATPRQPLYKRIQEIRLQEIENEKKALLLEKHEKHQHE